jgi:hypothetical protein
MIGAAHYTEVNEEIGHENYCQEFVRTTSIDCLNVY